VWANKRIKLTRKKRRGFFVLVAAGKFNYYQNSLASNFCGQFMLDRYAPKRAGSFF